MGPPSVVLAMSTSSASGSAVPQSTSNSAASQSPVHPSPDTALPSSQISLSGSSSPSPQTGTFQQIPTSTFEKMLAQYSPEGQSLEAVRQRRWQCSTVSSG